MASSIDTANRKAGSNVTQMDFNVKVATGQRDKTAFRADKVSASADPYKSGVMPVKEDRY